jgi:hypothetical protein
MTTLNSEIRIVFIFWGKTGKECGTQRGERKTRKNIATERIQVRPWMGTINARTMKTPSYGFTQQYAALPLLTHDKVTTTEPTVQPRIQISTHIRIQFSFIKIKQTT